MPTPPARFNSQVNYTLYPSEERRARRAPPSRAASLNAHDLTAAAIRADPQASPAGKKQAGSTPAEILEMTTDLQPPG